MKDTYCEHCNYPYFDFKTTANGYTTSDIISHINNEDDTMLDINIFHESANDTAMIYDGSFSIHIKYCPWCGRRLGK